MFLPSMPESIFSCERQPATQSSVPPIHDFVIAKMRDWDGFKDESFKLYIIRVA